MSGTIARAAAGVPVPHRRAGSLAHFARRRSTVAFLMALPLILIIAGLVAWPAMCAIYLSTLNRRMTASVGLDNYLFLLESETFRMVVWQSCFFAVTAVLLKALIGFWLAHMLHTIPARGQRKWRGLLLIPWVIPPALSTLGWWWMFDPSYSSINWILNVFGFPSIPWLGTPWWARIAVVTVNVWYGAPFFMIMYLAALKSVPEQLYESGGDRRCDGFAEAPLRDAADDAQHHRHHRPVQPDRHLRQLRHRARAHQRRAAR